MGWFKSSESTPMVPENPTPPTEHQSLLPITQIDPTKRYDLYVWLANEERLYANVRLVGLQQFDTVKEYSSAYSAYLEIEFEDLSRILIPQYCIQTICEHGTRPKYHVLKQNESYF